MDFIECDICAAKPGTPNLCHGCLHNRDTITALRSSLREKEEEVERLKAMVDVLMNKADVAIKEYIDKEIAKAGGR